MVAGQPHVYVYPRRVNAREGDAPARTPPRGLLLDEIAVTADRYWVAFVLADEVECGRVMRDKDGRYRLMPGSLDPNVAAALLAVGPDDHVKEGA